MENACQQEQADAVGNYYYDILPKQSVSHPESNAESEQTKHIQGEVVGSSCVPAFLQLRNIRNCRAQCCYGSDRFSEHGFHVLRLAITALLGVGSQPYCGPGRPKTKIMRTVSARRPEKRPTQRQLRVSRPTNISGPHDVFG